MVLLNFLKIHGPVTYIAPEFLIIRKFNGDGESIVLYMLNFCTAF